MFLISDSELSPRAIDLPEPNPSDSPSPALATASSPANTPANLSANLSANLPPNLPQSLPANTHLNAKDHLKNTANTNSNTNINTSVSLGYELRASLASIHGALRLLTRDQDSVTDPNARRLLRIAMSNTHRLLSLAVAIEGETQQPNVLTTAAIERLRLANELQGAAERGEFILVYQPVICLVSGRTVGLEALVRWEHPTRGLLQPDSFIAIAESSGFIAELGLWAIREACTQLRHWQRTGMIDSDLWVSVNLSPCQLLEPNLLGQCEAILRETELSPQCLHLELTESVALDLGMDVLAILQGFRQLGIAIYVDDFGTGYSSLARLHEFPIDALKIDRSFILREQWEIVRMIALLAEHLGIQIVAEGIESVHHLHTLQGLGCQMAQGFLISRPLDASAVIDFIQDLDS
ncbi:EAL domain-containing protein [Limnothrix redekei]|uniref:EAL domain-containing protein n=1 Tax=Limnothrix redekei LRLZ20PSL1 TaxID=3112953 RepID=A0ABW7CHF8_9CYAN